MKRFIHNQKGFSLVELLVSLAVGSLVILAVLALVAQATKGYRVQTETSQLQNDANIAMTQIEGNIMEGEKLCIGLGVGPVVGANTQYVVTKDDVIYGYDGSTLYLESATGEKSVVVENVSAFQVRISADGVRCEGKTIDSVIRPLQVQVYMKLEQNGISREVTKKINMRNNIQIANVQIGAGNSFETVKGKDISKVANYFYGIEAE